MTDLNLNPLIVPVSFNLDLAALAKLVAIEIDEDAVADLLREKVLAKFDASDIAQHIEASDIADNIDVNDVAEALEDRIDVDEVARSVADNIDTDDIEKKMVDQIDMDEVHERAAKRIDNEEVASHLDMDALAACVNDHALADLMTSQVAKLVGDRFEPKVVELIQVWVAREVASQLAMHENARRARSWWKRAKQFALGCLLLRGK